MHKRGRPSGAHKAGDKVECGLCRKTLRYDSLGKHFSAVHPGKDKLIWDPQNSNKKQKTLNFPSSANNFNDQLESDVSEDSDSDQIGIVNKGFQSDESDPDDIVEPTDEQKVAEAAPNARTPVHMDA